ncbi:YbdD/YjiX family protein [Lysobacter sp. KIS68-7]|uniref:YbdD/YjiX family protein n=1 Tax=Lysobacter sp. KIS68-7 TaxID=2904252 RepID=UPI001E543FE3|nr:YbdD/YjiX family protein [Lysobacter sp. KIS68-7]UHQ19639.1 YbdD/YjiX family protein [Lysobacter sp. KIS68-7]
MPFAERLRTEFADAWRAAKQTARLAIGMPDYEVYVAHVRACHPEATPMTREAFAIERMQARYARGRSRCC